MKWVRLVVVLITFSLLFAVWYAVEEHRHYERSYERIVEKQAAGIVELGSAFPKMEDIVMQARGYSAFKIVSQDEGRIVFHSSRTSGRQYTIMIVLKPGLDAPTNKPNMEIR